MNNQVNDRTLWWLRWIRYFVLTTAIIASLGCYFYWLAVASSQQLLTIRLGETYGFISLILLYFALLIGPFYDAFPNLPGRGLWTRARRAIGVSAFFYALLHSLVSFFGELGGFPGLSFLSRNYYLAVLTGLIALIIMTLMAATSFDYMVKRLGKNWKRLHRFIYLGGWLVIVHVFLIGTHFILLTSWPAQLLVSALAFLFILEALRIDNWVRQRWLPNSSHGLTFVILTAIIITTSYIFLFPGAGLTGVNIHAQHIQLAKQVQTNANNPALIGDKTKRYSVSFNHPDSVLPNQDTPLAFQVFDASSGNPVLLFGNVYSKPMHLVIVNSQLDYFSHIHPTLGENNFTIKTQFPKADTYHLYLNFQPLGAVEQQFAFTLKVGSGQTTKSTQPIDTNLTKTFGSYEITLSLPQTLKASELSIGNQKLTFTLKDAKTKQPITNLQPYLAAFGHLVLINQDSYDYLHVHPTTLTPPAVNATSGPTVEFLPLGLYGPIKAGTYRAFAEFNPGGQLITADYTIKIEP